MIVYRSLLINKILIITPKTIHNPKTQQEIKKIKKLKQERSYSVSTNLVKKKKK